MARRAHASGKVSTASYDPRGHLLSLRDPNATGRDCQYDGLGQEVSCTDTHGDTTTHEYDAAGTIEHHQRAGERQRNPVVAMKVSGNERERPEHERAFEEYGQ